MTWFPYSGKYWDSSDFHKFWYYWYNGPSLYYMEGTWDQGLKPRRDRIKAFNLKNNLFGGNAFFSIAFLNHILVYKSRFLEEEPSNVYVVSIGMFPPPNSLFIFFSCILTNLHLTKLFLCHIYIMTFCVI